MFESIVLASDLSAASERVIRCVQAWRPAGLRRVVVAHVHHIRHTGGDETLLRRDHAPKLEAQVATLRAGGLETSWRLEFGVPYLEMNRIAAEERAQAIVMGSHGKTWLKEVFLGSIGDAMLRHSEIPVVVIKVSRLREMPLEECAGACRGMFSSILLAIDLSPASEAAVETVRPACGRVHPTVHLVHVQEGAPASPQWAYLVDEHRRKAAERLGTLEDELRRAGAAEVTSSVRTDHPVFGILSAIEAEQPTIVVVGRHTRHYLMRRLLLGSTSHEVARHSPVPVVVVPAVGRDTGLV